MTEVFRGSINADLIILGNSRARRHIDPKIVDSVLSVDSYNLGQDATGFRIQKMIYDLYRQHNQKPKYIVHIVGSGTLEEEDGLYERIKFAPYLNDSLVRAITIEIKGFDKLDYYLPYFKYSGFPNEIKAGLASFFGMNGASNEEVYKGFPKTHFDWNNVIFERFKNEFPNGTTLTISDELIEAMDAYIQSCKDEGIEIVLVYPPIYNEAKPYFQNNPQILDILKGLAQKNEIPFLDYSEDSLSYSKENFADHVHMSSKGAEIFTKRLSQDLKNLFKTER
ncbi:SGNH/GDSL hydrolase family protein [Roseivirga pacifica]|uniref:SGNH/GDSL hydrolase family protein n=1 Tax=Roseivirga pacifica TaxID=1267423 RepID=UPI003BAE8544